MARILMVLWRSRSRNMAALTLGRRLVIEGHEVTVASPEDIGELVEASQLPYHAWRSVIAPVQPWRTRNGMLSLPLDLAKALSTWRARRRALVDASALKQAREALEALRPDLVLCDIELPQFTIVVSAAGFRVVQIDRSADLTQAEGVPPIHTDLVPAPTGDATPEDIEQAWAERRRSNHRFGQKQFLQHLGADRAAALAELARLVHFDLDRETTDEGWLRLLTFRHIPVALMHPQTMDFPRPATPMTRYLGALIDPDRDGVAIGSESAELDRFLAADGPLVVCAFGTYYPGDDRMLFRRVIEVARARPEFRFVIGTGGRIDIETLGELPGNTLALGWIPQLRVLAQADAAIVHSGASTVIECAYYGVPAVLLPFAMNDQLGSAARVAFHQLGIVLDRNTVSAEALGEALATALDDPALRARCEAASDTLKREEADGLAVMEIEKLLSETLDEPKRSGSRS